MNTHWQKQQHRKQKIWQGEKKRVTLFMSNVHIIIYNTSRSYLYGLIITIIFKVLLLSKITNILPIFVNNTNNVHANDLAYYFFFKKAIYTGHL